MIQKLSTIQAVTVEKVNELIGAVNNIGEMRVSPPLELTRNSGNIQIRLPVHFDRSANYYNENPAYRVDPVDGFTLTNISSLGNGLGTGAEVITPGPLIPELFNSRGGYDIASSSLVVPAGSGDVEITGTFTFRHSMACTSVDQFCANPVLPYNGRFWTNAVVRHIGNFDGGFVTNVAGMGQFIPIDSPPNQTISTGSITNTSYTLGHATVTGGVNGSIWYTGQVRTYFRISNSNNDETYVWCVRPFIYSVPLVGLYHLDYQLETLDNTNLEYRIITKTQSQLVPASPGFAQPWLAVSATETGSGAVPVNASFTCSVTNAIGSVTYAWDFGDGGTSTLQNPSHTYTSAGPYFSTWTVLVIVTDSVGRQAVGGTFVYAY